MKKPQREIYAIMVKEIGIEGKPMTVTYMVGNTVPSYTGKPTKIEAILLKFGKITISYEDSTERIFGYDYMTMELFTRLKDETNAGTNND